MKKRIISLILVAVMALLTLASCAFNYSNENMGKYAEFNNTVFKDKIAALTIEDGEFSQADAAKRADMVMDAIWAAIAAKADTTDKLVGKVDDPDTEEVEEADEAIGEHDLVFYAYYATATVDGKEYMFFTKNMKDPAAKVQLGQKVFGEGKELDEKIIEAIKGFTFTEDGAYVYKSSGTVAEDQWVYVSYVRTYEKTNDEGAVVKYTETVTDHRMQVGKGVDAEFTKLLAGKAIGTSEITGISEVTIGDVKYTYDDIYVKGAEESGTEFTFKYIPYEKDDYKDGKKEDATYYEGSDSTKKQIDLAGVELTYHVFPAHYVKVADYTVETIMNDVFGANISIANIAKIMFGDKYLALIDEDHTHEEGDDSHEDELEELYDSIMLKDKDGNDVDVNEFVKLLSTAMSEYKTAKDEYDKAVTAYDNALEDLKKAYEAYYGDGADKKGALKEYEEAVEATKAAGEALEAAKKAYDDAVAADNTVSDEALNAALDLIKNDKTNKADLEKKENAVKDATGKVTAAEEKVAKAEADLAAAEEADKEAFQKALDSANEELTAATKALEDANKAVAETVIKKAEANAVDNKIAVLEAAKTTAESAKTAAEKDEATKKSTSETKKTALNTERKDYGTARKTLYGIYDYFTNEVEDADYATKIKAYEDALKAYNDDKSDANKTAVITAYKALITNTEDPAYNDEAAALKTNTGKDQTYTDKKDARDKLVKTFTDTLTEKNIDFKFQYEYYVQYKALEDAYNLEIKQAIAKEIYNNIFVPSVTVKDLPKAEIDKVYEELIDNFQFFFYENYDLEKWLENGYSLTARDEKLTRYYDQYGASFERFLAEYAVKTAFGENVNNATEAKNAVRARASEIVKERIVVYTVAEGLGIKFTDETFKAYAKDEKGIDDIFQYDDSVVEDYRLAFQVEKILDTVIGITDTLATEGDGYKANVISLNTEYFKDGKLPIKEEETDENTGA